MAFLDVYGILMCMAFCLAFCASEVCRNEFCFGGILLNAVDQFWHFSSISFVFLPFSFFPAIFFYKKISETLTGISSREDTPQDTGKEDAVEPGAAPVPKAAGAAPAKATAPVTALPTDVAVNSTNFRKEYHQLKRVAEGPRAALFPNVAKAFSGTKQEQRDVLKKFPAARWQFGRCGG